MVDLWHWVVQVLHQDGHVRLGSDKLVDELALALQRPERDGPGCVAHAQQHHFLPAGGGNSYLKQLIRQRW